MKYKLVIFDFDGTLADTFPWFKSVMNSVADKFNFKQIKNHEIETVRDFDAAKMIKHLNIPLWKIPQIARHIRSLMSKEIDKIRLFDGIAGELQKLVEKGTTLALVSTNSEQNIRTVLGKEVSDLFHYFECGVSLFGKPNKLKNVIHKSGINNNETIYIGDEIRDIQAARNINIAFGAATWGFNSAGSLSEQQPDVLFHSVTDIASGNI